MAIKGQRGLRCPTCGRMTVFWHASARGEDAFKCRRVECGFHAFSSGYDDADRLHALRAAQDPGRRREVGVPEEGPAAPAVATAADAPERGEGPALPTFRCALPPRAGEAGAGVWHSVRASTAADAARAVRARLGLRPGAPVNVQMRRDADGAQCPDDEATAVRDVGVMAALDAGASGPEACARGVHSGHGRPGCATCAAVRAGNAVVPAMTERLRILTFLRARARAETDEGLRLGRGPRAEQHHAYANALHRAASEIEEGEHERTQPTVRDERNARERDAAGR